MLAFPMLLLLALPAFAQWPSLPQGGWTPVQSGPLIACTSDAEGLPWCYAEADSGVSFARVVAVIRDLEHYPDTFDHVDKVKRLDSSMAWIHIDYPSPLSDREYVAAFSQVADSEAPGPAGAVNSFHIRFRAAESAAAPPTGDAIRLPRIAGGYDAWDLGGGITRVRYTWETEIGGDLPTWITDRARLTHGEEVVGGIVKAAANTSSQGL